jgi:3-hydroxybutyryl-CoA dehydrogenase
MLFEVKMDIKLVGVVGCGTMGSGIAQVCAQSGYQVIVSEVSQPLLDRGLRSINNNLTKGIEKGKLTQQDKESTLSRIKGTTDMHDFRDCDLIIEAAVENLDLKKKIFTELDKIAPPQAILGTNTSCLSVTEIARSTKRPEKVIGLHFFNPAPLMALLEMVITLLTGEETVKTGEAFAMSLGKTVVKAKDTRGFIANRLGMPSILNSIRMLENGVASREEIDNTLKLGFNNPMGPLALADLIGLDVVFFIVNSIYEESKDAQYVPPTLLRRMVAAGWLGRKTGRGFYEYK